MENNRKPRLMDFAPKKRPGMDVSRPPVHNVQQSSPRPASPYAVPRPQQMTNSRPQQMASPRPQQAASPRLRTHRPAGANKDPLSARPVSRPARKSSAQIIMPTSPRTIKTTTVKSVEVTPNGVDSYEFGVIEDLSPVVAPEPPVVPSTPRPEPPRPSTPEPKKESPLGKFSRGKSARPVNTKSPFLTSVNVPKRPLSASAPTGTNAPGGPEPVRPTTPEPIKKKARKNAPFIVIIILSVFLGVSLGALVYFILPH